MKLKDLPVGALVKDVESTYYGIPLVGIVLEHDHDGQGITSLLSEKIITLKCFDAKESTNPDTKRLYYGNNRYLYSNIFQWLNKDSSNWYVSQHTYDASPTDTNVWGNYNEYDTEAGFLSGFSAQMKAALQTVSKVTVKPSVDGGGTETVSGKIHLLSTTEIGLANEGEIAEGTIYNYFSGDNNTDTRRIAYPTQQAVNNSEYTTSSLATDKGWLYWLRTPYASNSYSAFAVAQDGSSEITDTYRGNRGVRPVWFLSSDITVSDTPDIDGAYKISWGAKVSKVYIGDTEGKAKRIYPAGETRTMTARFNLSDSNPATWGEYLDDAANMTAGDSAWDAFFGHYPAMIKNGAIVGELDPSEGYAKYIDGTAADITSGTDGDVMIVFPRRDLRIWQDNGYLYVSMTGELGKANYDHYAHKYKGNDCDWFALGRYKGYYDGTKLRSLSGKTPTVSQTIGTFRTYAQANGTGYEQSAFFQLTYRQAMYMLKYLGQNAQIAIGRGFVDGNSAVYGATGYTDDKGLDWGETTGKFPMTLFGLEDFYGNIFEWVDGIRSNTDRQLSAADGNYNDTGSGYIAITDKTSASNYAGYLKTVLGTNAGGFAPDVSTVSDYSSATTYYCDSANVYAERNAAFGGYWTNDDTAGVFHFYVIDVASSVRVDRGSRLMYMHAA